MDGQLFKKLNSIKVTYFMFKHSKCHNCGNRLVGNGEGSFILKENYYQRSCKCGHKVEVIANRNYIYEEKSEKNVGV